MNNYIDQDNVSPKSHTIAGLLCFVLGMLGAHRFYVGKYKSGLLYLIFTLSAWATIFINAGMPIFLYGLIFFISMMDFVLIMYDSFDDKDGKLLCSESYLRTGKKEPFVAFITTSALCVVFWIVVFFNRGFLPHAILFSILALVYFIKELHYLKN